MPFSWTAAMTESGSSDDFATRAHALLEQKFAPWVQELALTVESTAPIVLRLRCRPELSRIGGIVCGQAIMAAADTAMVLAISEALGGFIEMSTVNMNTSFLAPLIEEDGLIGIQLTKVGKTMAFGEGRVTGVRSGKVCAQTSLVYALKRP
jgi:acyl-coenzyme A thioesterase PaaI-like protein